MQPTKNPWREIYDHPKSVDPFKHGMPKFALYMDIEPTNDCNLSCKFCVRKQMKRDIGYMDLDLYKEICRQAEKYGCRGIRLLRWGEPLLHPQICDFVRVAKSHNQLTHITTNGTLLDKQLAKDLITSGLDSIIFSFQGLNEKEYTKLRGHHYNKIINNIYQLLDLRDKLDVKNPWIHISTTVTDESENEIEEFRNKWEKIVDSVGVGYTWFRRLKDKHSVSEFIKRSKKLPHNFRCIEVMVKLSIDWDGTVSPCCLDYDRQLSIGNIKEKNLLNLWNSEEANAIRTLLSNRRQDMFVLCSTCELNYPFRGKL